MTIATYKWTIDRYHQAIESGIFDGQNLELLRGDLILIPPEGEPHVYFSDRAAQILRSILLGQAGKVEGSVTTPPLLSETERETFASFRYSTCFPFVTTDFVLLFCW